MPHGDKHASRPTKSRRSRTPGKKSFAETPNAKPVPMSTPPMRAQRRMSPTAYMRTPSASRPPVRPRPGFPNSTDGAKNARLPSTPMMVTGVDFRRYQMGSPYGMSIDFDSLAIRGTGMSLGRRMGGDMSWSACTAETVKSGAYASFRSPRLPPRCGSERLHEERPLGNGVCTPSKRRNRRPSGSSGDKRSVTNARGGWNRLGNENEAIGWFGAKWGDVSRNGQIYKYFRT